MAGCILDIPDIGFKTLNFHFPSEKAFNIYHLFDSICRFYEEDYHQYFSEYDQVIDAFISECNLPLANQTLKLKHIRADEFKYKARTNVEYKIYSYQYLAGLYDYMKERIFSNRQFLQFFQELDQCNIFIKEMVQPVIEEVEKKTKTATVLKIWKHNPLEGNPLFLPLHYDRSIFTVIVHTQSSGEECLRIYPSTPTFDFKKIAEESSPIIPKKSEFPLIFPGMHAKTHFSINPTPHSVVSNRRLERRYSLVFFIAQIEGW